MSLVHARPQPDFPASSEHGHRYGHVCCTTLPECAAIDLVYCREREEGRKEGITFE